MVVMFALWANQVQLVKPNRPQIQHWSINQAFKNHWLSTELVMWGLNILALGSSIIYVKFGFNYLQLTDMKQPHFLSTSCTFGLFWSLSHSDISILIWTILEVKYLSFCSHQSNIVRVISVFYHRPQTRACWIKVQVPSFKPRHLHHSDFYLQHLGSKREQSVSSLKDK